MDTLLNQADTAIAKAKAHIDREIAILKSKKLLGGCELEEMFAFEVLDDLEPK